MANRAWIVASRAWWSDSPRLLISRNARNEPQRADLEVGQDASAAHALIDPTETVVAVMAAPIQGRALERERSIDHHNRP